MAGIYLHIPFCKRKCHYCDFYSTTNIELADNLINAIKSEIKIRYSYLSNEKIESIYFGGGSPSMLSISQVEILINEIKKYFVVDSNSEITFECNPDDLSFTYLKCLKELGINRISIGIQSFNDEVLEFLNRRHNSKGGIDAICWAKDAGFDNISIDLMFGIPGMSNEVYKESLMKAINFKTKHISAYHLNIEPNTLLYKKLAKGLIKNIDEEISLNQFELTIDKLKENGYKHYEISNYALNGYESKHNWLYWSNGKYIGIGPSAHSYNGESRQWNINNTSKYINSISNNANFFDIEVLTDSNKFNEYILTSLRTSKGLSVEYVHNNFDECVYNHFIKILYKFINEGYIVSDKDGNWIINKRGIFILDLIVQKFAYI